MIRALKIAGGLLFSALLFLVAAGVGLKLYFTPARIKAVTADYASKNLRREVSFDSASLNFSGLSITKLRVSEYPDFKRGEFFSAESFSVRPSLRALLQKRVQINSVSAEGLRMRVTEVRKDTYNFSDLIAAGPAPRPAQAAGKRPPAPPLAISSLKVKNSRFTYANAAGDMTITLRDINLSASGISPEGLFPLEAACAIDVASPYFTGTVPARLKGRVSMGGWDPAKGRAEIESGSFSLGGVKAEVKGSLKGLMEPDAKLSISVKPFSTADLKTVFKGLPAKVLLPEIDADADFKLTFTGVNLRSVKFAAGPVKGSLRGQAAWEPAVNYALLAELKAQSPEMDSTVLARKVKQLPIPRGFKLPLTELAATALLKPGLADIRSFSLETDGLSASGRARVDYAGGSVKASGRARADIKNLARLATAAPDLAASYAPSGGALAELDFSYAETLALKGKASLNGLGAAYAGKKLSGLTGTVEFTKDSASSKALEGRLDGEDLKASFTARDLMTHPKASFTLKLARLVLKDLPAAAAGAGTAGGKTAAAPQFYLDVAGKAEIGAVEHPNFRCGRVTASLDLVNISEDLKSLDGEATFTAGPGKFSQLYALAGKYKAAKVALYPLLVLQKSSGLAKALRLPDFNNIEFQSIEGDYFFLKGLMKINKSVMLSGVADVASSGTINLPGEKLDMKINTTLKQGSGIRMSAPLGMYVKGTFAEPSVKADMKSIAEQPAVKKAVNKLAPAADKLLKGLFKK
ncbi:MAG: hypothetical protein A2X31_01800 [Elusimicrobia bacterium GWB2_63_22]|nr:MAG: hypothetical protein A2X31_01800 [Elusimicrobia bacterium GWB2_63_22]